MNVAFERNIARKPGERSTVTGRAASKADSRSRHQYFGCGQTRPRRGGGYVDVIIEPLQDCHGDYSDFGDTSVGKISRVTNS
jgi:hypothetical protein